MWSAEKHTESKRVLLLRQWNKNEYILYMSKYYWKHNTSIVIVILETHCTNEHLLPYDVYQCLQEDYTFGREFRMDTWLVRRTMNLHLLAGFSVSNEPTQQETSFNIIFIVLFNTDWQCKHQNNITSLEKQLTERVIVAGQWYTLSIWVIETVDLEVALLQRQHCDVSDMYVFCKDENSHTAVV